MYYEHFAVASYEALYIADSDFAIPQFEVGAERSFDRQQALLVLDSIDPQYRSYTVILNRFRARIALSLSNYDYAKAARDIEDWKQFYIDKPHLKSTSRIGEIQLATLNCLLLGRQCCSAVTIENPAKNFYPGRTNWCLSTILTTFAHLYRDEYVVAFQLYLELRDTYSEMIYASEVYEKRILLEAYLWIATSILEPGVFGHDSPTSEIPFRLTTFLNAMHVLARYKRTDNALIVIAHAFVLLIQDKDEDAAYRRVAHLNVYASRYLKGDAEERLWCCVKAMQKILAYRYRPRELRKAIDPFIRRIQELESLPMKSGMNEVIRWDRLLTAYVDWEVRRQYVREK
jgi:hypothetical protein